MNVRLIIGLGNPDPEYANTYHNIGFLAVDYLSKNPPISNYQLPITKSDVYMNESGKFVAKEIKKAGAKPEELLVVHDDSDIELGKYKLSFGRGAAGHHGVESVQTTLKTKNFWRLRIGIRPAEKKSLPAGRQAPEKRLKAGDFVLKKITPADKKILEKTFEEIVAKLDQS